MNKICKRILVIGAHGQIGWELRRSLAPLGEIIALGRDDLDLMQMDKIPSMLANIQPNLIINAAAYTAVDRAEKEPEQAMVINGYVPRILAEEAYRQRAALIHYSTDYVFEGQKDSPYCEIDIPQPINVYGHTKLVGEQTITAVGGAYLILRTGWVYGLRGHNFLLTMQRLAQEREVIRVVDDQFGAPTWSRLVAEGTAQIIAQARGRIVDYIRERAGIYHLSCQGKASWYNFAQAILDHLNPAVRLEPISTSNYPTLAQRPAFSCLDNRHIQDVFGIQLPDWKAALALSVDS